MIQVPSPNHNERQPGYVIIHDTNNDNIIQPLKTQIWIAVSVYVLVAIIKKKLHLDASLYTLLQMPSTFPPRR